ncbi:C40 family peptidase [Kurthia sibirica]|uniref:Glycoside hydrolase n=1 Tax=Kurthia sibirica TaxID=202750 RepID=A0A2U3AIZ1_9BACL|nr:SH3 domain-containing C40 family peptidase [Kurthia sibirica]PWI24454.1 glycoside hydrolase [Kurthia sibirica]GEK35159.1 peptidase P60 [Kurthia sibirica]
MRKNKIVTAIITGALALTVAFTGVTPQEASAASKSTKVSKSYYTTAALNMRTDAGAKKKRILTVPKGKKLHATAKKSASGTWYKVSYKGKKGWVSGSYLSSKKGKKIKKVSSTSGNSIINAGRKYIGTPYVWGGSRPGGFDCSGFTSYVYKQAGMKSLPRTSRQQQAAVKRVSSPKVGDLIFFSASPGGNYITHVGIYAGNNQVLHAAGNSVKFQSLSGYWNQRVVSYGTTR